VRREHWIAAGILVLLLLALGWLAARGGQAPEPAVEPISNPSHPADTAIAVTQPSMPTEPSVSVELDAIPFSELTPVFRGPCTVRGVVVDTEGKPVVGAMLEVLMVAVALGDMEARLEVPWDPTWQEEDHVSDVDGRFEFELDSHCPRSVAAVTGDRRRGECRMLFPRQGQVECMLVVRPAWDLRGTVVDLDGVPVAGARVSATPDANFQQFLAMNDPESTDVESDIHELDFFGIWGQRGYSGKDGRFAIEQLAADDWVLLVEKQGYQRVTVAVSEEDLVGGGGVRMVVEPLECWTLQVVGEGGEPVSGAEVVVTPFVERATPAIIDAMTDESGSVEVCEVSARNAQLGVRTPSHTTEYVRNRDGLDPLVIQLHDSGTVVGALAVHVDGTPATMTLRVGDCVRPDGSSCDGFLLGGSCAPGPFRIDNVPAGELTIKMGCFKGYKDDVAYFDRVDRRIRVRPGETTDLGEVSFIDPEYSASP